MEPATDSILEFVKHLDDYDLFLNINDWVKELDGIDPYGIHPNITYDLVMVVENKPSAYKKINMINFYTNFQDDPTILAINAVDLYEMIDNSEFDKMHVPDSLKKIIMLAFSETSVYLKNNQSVPIDMMAKLIKIKILLLIWESLYTKNMELIKAGNRDDFYAPPPPEPKGGKGGKDKKKDAGGKGKGKDKGKGDEVQCGDVLNKSVISTIAPTNYTDLIPQTHLYIILTGFYSTKLIQYLTLNGFHLSILIRFQESVKELSMENIMQSGTSIFTQQSLTESMLESDLFSKKSTVLNSFWNKIIKEYGEYNRYHLNESFIMNYIPPSMPDEFNSEDYFNQCENVYLHFMSFLNKYGQFRELHKTYLDHLVIHKLGEGYYLTTTEMPFYENMIDSIPLSICCSPFIIEGVLDEIMKREEQSTRYPTFDEASYMKLKEKKGHTSSTRWENLYTSSSSSTITIRSCKKSGDLYPSTSYYYADVCNQSQSTQKLKQYAFPCHVSFNDQIKRLLNFYRKRIIEYRNESKGDEFQFLPVLDKNPYIIHESNSIELALNYFKYIPNCVKDIWIKSLQQNAYIEMCKNLRQASSEDESFTRKQLKDWCNILEINIDELINTVLLLFYGQIFCNTKYISSSSSFASEHFCTREIKTIIDTTIEVNSPICSEEPLENHYETLTPADFKWLEDLSPIVALQTFFKLQDDYCCIDWKRVEMFNAVLFRFHNDCDEFGFNQKRWHVTLRTPVNFRIFMHSTVFKDTDFLMKHERKRDILEYFYEEIMKSERVATRFKSEHSDFLFKDSLKVLLSNPPVEPVADDGKKGKKDKDKDAKKDKKGADKGGAKGKPKKDMNPKEVIDTETYEPAMTIKELKGNTLIRGYIDKTTLPAIEYNDDGFKASGCTTTFHSLDYFTIKVDKYKIVDEPLTISASISLNENSLHVHNKSGEDFAFHINLKNGGIVSFGKTPKTDPRNMTFYFVESLQNKHLHCLGGAVPQRRETIMAASCFHNTMRVPELYIKEGFPQDVGPQSTVLKGISKYSVKSLTSKIHSWAKDKKPAQLIESLTGVIPIKQEDYGIEPQAKLSELYLNIDLGEEEEERIPSFNLQGFVDDIVQFKTHLPAAKFKILSSPLHKYSYIKRKKSDMDVILSDLIRYVLSMYKNKKQYLKVKHAYDLNDETETKPGIEEPELSLRITLPNGLHLQNIFHSNNSYIIQKYLVKGPEEADISDEEYRLFLKNGTIAIRKINGDFLLFGCNAEIVHYQIPLNKKNWLPFMLFKKKDNSKKNVENLLKTINRRVKRINQDNLGDFECTHYVSRTSNSYRRKQFKCHKAFVLKQIKFKRISCDGKISRYHNGNIKVIDSYTYQKEEQIDVFQTVYKRSDGTVSIFNKFSVLETTFRDGTRITSWCEVDPELVTLDLFKRLGIVVKIPPFVKINMFFRYEHPKYSAVTYDIVSNEMVFNIPGDIQVKTSGNSYSLVSSQKTLFNVEPEKVVMESAPCQSCQKYCICKVNTKSLFYNDTLSNTEVFFKASDTYDKLIKTYFDGNIKRNSDYITKKTPCDSGCHKRYPPQSIMLMFNDLRAKYLWSETMYSNRISDTMKSENTHLILYVNDTNNQVSTTDIRVYEPFVHNGQFKMSYLPPMVINKDPKVKFDSNKAAYMKQRLLHSISISGLKCLLSAVNKDEASKGTMKAKSFDFNKFMDLCEPKNAAKKEDLNIAKKSKKDLNAIHALFEIKRSEYKQRLAAILEKVMNAKNQKTITPYFTMVAESKKPGKTVLIKNAEGRLVEADILSERLGQSNRSLAGSVIEAKEKYTSMSDIAYELLDHINFDDGAPHIYERQPSYTVAIPREEAYPANNEFSITTLDSLIVTVKSDSNINVKDDKEILVGKSETEIEKNNKRADSKLRFDDNNLESTIKDKPKIFSDIQGTNKESIQNNNNLDTTIVNPLESDDTFNMINTEEDGCMKELQESFKNLVLQGNWEGKLSSSKEDSSKSSEKKDNNIKKTKPIEPNKISLKLERLFNIIRKPKKEEQEEITVQEESLPVIEELSDETAKLSSTEGSVSSESKSESYFGKDYVTSPSLQTVTSQMLKPSYFEKFSLFEIQTLLEDAGVKPLTYHEISDLDLVKQLIGLAGAATKNIKPDQEMANMPEYEGMECKKKQKGEEDALMDSDDEKIDWISSSCSSKNPDECKEPGDDQISDKDVFEQSSISSNATSLTSIHKAQKPHSAQSFKHSVFEDPISVVEINVPRQASMIPLMNEKSLLRTVKKDLKRVAKDLSSNRLLVKQKPIKNLLTDSSSSFSTIESKAAYTYSESRTTSTTNTIVDAQLSGASEGKAGSESKHDGALNIQPSMRVFRDLSSFDSKYYNVIVQSVGVGTADNKEEEVGTDLPYSGKS